MFFPRRRMPYAQMRRAVRNLPQPGSYAEYLSQEALRQQFRRRRRKKKLLWLARYNFRPPGWWWGL